MSIQIGRTTATHAHSRSIELLAWLSLDHAPTSITLARQFVKIALAARGYEQTSNELELIVSELVTNAVLHARSSPEQPILVRLLANGATLRLEVQDPDVRLPITRPMGCDVESGRGLHIVRALTDHMGSYLRDRGSGKVVWCELATREKREE